SISITYAPPLVSPSSTTKSPSVFAGFIFCILNLEVPDTYELEDVRPFGATGCAPNFLRNEQPILLKRSAFNGVVMAVAAAVALLQVHFKPFRFVHRRSPYSPKPPEGIGSSSGRVMSS